jgi:GNAT superfamily N-acetyltransferase
MLDFLEELFETNKIIPLKKKGNLKYELEYQRHLIIDYGFEIINTFENRNSILILYRHFFEDTPKDDEPTITLSLRIITEQGVRYPEPIIKAFFNDNFTKINLADIDIKEHMFNKGYGSILLSNLVNIAKKRDVSIISGWISRVDINHIERLLHFYQKHGFEIILKETADKTYNIGDLVWVNN